MIILMHNSNMYHHLYIQSNQYMLIHNQYYYNNNYFHNHIIKYITLQKLKHYINRINPNPLIHLIMRNNHIQNYNTSNYYVQTCNMKNYNLMYNNFTVSIYINIYLMLKYLRTLFHLYNLCILLNKCNHQNMKQIHNYLDIIQHIHYYYNLFYNIHYNSYNMISQYIHFHQLYYQHNIYYMYYYIIYIYQRQLDVNKYMLLLYHYIIHFILNLNMFLFHSYNIHHHLSKYIYINIHLYIIQFQSYLCIYYNMYNCYKKYNIIYHFLIHINNMSLYILEHISLVQMNLYSRN